MKYLITKVVLFAYSKHDVIVLAMVVFGWLATIWSWLTDPCDTNAYRTGLCR